MDYPDYARIVAEKVSKGEITQHCRTMSIRREIRLRKEFLHRKQVNVNEMIKLEKKRKIKAAIEQGKAVPTELRNEARELKHEMENDIETLDERCIILYLCYFVPSLILQWA